jgi:BirA family transcriptional regulator, biotin operon repressor / biotin---[acetyl-CoA-carboxylase] ligase
MIGTPRVHHRVTDSTNERAKELAAAGAPHGTLVTADEQTAGRGRQGREWTAPARSAVLMSVVLRELDEILPLAAAVAVADALPARATIKWPNDIWIGGRKVAGILVEGRPQEGWAVLGIGVNVAVRVRDLPAELHATAGTLGREPSDVEPFLTSLLAELERALALPPERMLESWRSRDALLGRPVRWSGGEGTAAGIDGEGRLVVELAGGGRTALDAGEVHLQR